MRSIKLFCSLILCIFASQAEAKDITMNDIVSAVAIVSQRLGVPTKINSVPYSQTSNVITAGWNSVDAFCHVEVSDNLNLVNYFFSYRSNQYSKEILEGVIAHEETHCVEQRALNSKFLPNHTPGFFMANNSMEKLQEISADIVSLMYWKQYYPTTSDYFMTWLVKYRWTNKDLDKRYDDASILTEVRHMLPDKVDFNKAFELRTIEP